MKLLWIGIDGFSFRMVERWGSDYFRRLRDNSQFGISRSVLTDEDFPLTGPNWATLYTGVQPATHGITDAGWLLDNLKYQDIRVNTVFDVIDRHHTQTLMTLPLTYPAFPVNGWMVSGFPTPDSLKNCFYPEDIGGLLPTGFKVSHAKCVRGMGWDRIRDIKVKRDLKSRFHSLAGSHIETFKAIYQARNTEAAFLGLTYIDRMNHLFIQKDPELQDAYRETFNFLEDLIRFCRPDNIIICSDHGFREDRREHDLSGFYLIKSGLHGPGRRDISNTEIAPAVLKVLRLKDKLGVPVTRDKVEIKTGKMREIKQRLKALGYI